MNAPTDQLVKRYKNFEFNAPYQHAMFETQSCVEVPKWDNKDKLDAMQGAFLNHGPLLVVLRCY